MYGPVVFIYWNLHKKCWSIRSQSGVDYGRVIAHASCWTVRDAVFKVSKAGRERVLQQKKKNVHAGVVGELTEVITIQQTVDTHADLWYPFDGSLAVEQIRYNPYVADCFQSCMDGRSVYTAHTVKADHRVVTAHLAT